MSGFKDLSAQPLSSGTIEVPTGGSEEFAALVECQAFAVLRLDPVPDLTFEGRHRDDETDLDFEDLYVGKDLTAWSGDQPFIIRITAAAVPPTQEREALLEID